jgi:hypothetical protein
LLHWLMVIPSGLNLPTWLLRLALLFGKGDHVVHGVNAWRHSSWLAIGGSGLQ